ncbi:MAG: MmgE/PrpD family protein [Solirubrobacteraceae bacterium]
MSAAEETATLSAALARWAVDFDVDAAPAEIREAALTALVNSVGTGVAAYRLPDVQRCIEVLADEQSSGPATVLLDGRRTAPLLALLPNTSLFNTLSQEETHTSSGTHPAETTVPILLTLGERLHASGKQLLEALIVGIETTVACASMELTPEVKVDNCFGPAVYGTIGAAAAAAKLSRFDLARTTHALGLAANLTGGLSECVHVGTSEYHFTVPHSSTSAYTAVALAGRGALAAPSAFEGHAGFYQLFGAVPRDRLAAHDVIADVSGRLGRAWALPELIYKPYPVYFFNQSLVDGARLIRQRDGFDPDAIESVQLVVGSFAMASGGPNRPPYADRDNVLGASGFCVASMLLRGSLTLADTQDIAAPDVLRLLEATHIAGDEELMTARILVRMDDGTEHSFDDATEGRDYRLALGEVEEIYRGAAANTYAPEQAERVLGRLRALEQLDDVATLVAEMVLDEAGA